MPEVGAQFCFERCCRNAKRAGGCSLRAQFGHFPFATVLDFGQELLTHGVRGGISSVTRQAVRPPYSWNVKRRSHSASHQLR
jgi:hypothetical protein